MSNEENNRRPQWGEIIYRTVLVLLLGAILTSVVTVSGNNEGLQATIAAHIRHHPDTGLTNRINRHIGRADARYDSLEERVRELERHEHERRE